MADPEAVRGRPAARSLDYDNQWGDDGEVLIAFGFHDRAEFAAAVSRYAVTEWDPWIEPYRASDVAHIYGVVDPSKDEPWLFWQTAPEHPGPFDVVPMTAIHAEGHPVRAPKIANLVDQFLDDAEVFAEDIADDRILAVVYAYEGEEAP